MLRSSIRAMLACALLSGPVSAADTDSAYTSLDLENKCQYLGSSGEAVDGGTWRCEGYEGMPVYVMEGDLRYYIAYGAPADQLAAWPETLPMFNMIHKTLEWRLERTGGGWRPFATILRFDLASDNIESQELVVTKLDEDRACIVATVDTRANRNANELAREAADRFARTFRCGVDRPFRHGATKGPSQVER